MGIKAGSNVTIGNNNIHIGNVGIAGKPIRFASACREPRREPLSPVLLAYGSGSAVVANTNGQLGVAASSERFKDEIKPMNKVSEAICAPAGYLLLQKRKLIRRGHGRWVCREDVEKVDPALVMRDKEGKAYSVRYDKVNAMLLNEFLKEHRRVEKQSGEILEQRANDH